MYLRDHSDSALAYKQCHKRLCSRHATRLGSNKIATALDKLYIMYNRAKYMLQDPFRRPEIRVPKVAL